MYAIYAIEFENNIYIGETTDLDARWARHKRYQEVAYGLLNIKTRPSFRVLCILDNNLTKKERIKIEQTWTKHFSAFKNIINNPPMSEDKKQKISQARKGKFLSESHKQKLREKNGGNNNPAYKGEKIILQNILTQEIRIFIGIMNCAREICGNCSGVRLLIDGKRLSHKGWKLYNE